MKTTVTSIAMVFALFQTWANPIIDPPVISEVNIIGQQIYIELYLEYEFSDLDLSWLNLVSSLDTVEFKDGIIINSNEPLVVTNSDFKEPFEFCSTGDFIRLIDDDGYQISYFESFIRFGDYPSSTLPVPGPNQSIAFDEVFDPATNSYTYNIAIESPVTLGYNPRKVNARGWIKGYVYDIAGNPVPNAILFGKVTNEQGFFMTNGLYCKNYRNIHIFLSPNYYVIPDTITVQPSMIVFHCFTIDTLLLTTQIDKVPEIPLVTNTPNPFSGKTTFIFYTSHGHSLNNACLNIYNLHGSLVEKIQLSDNCTSIAWDGSGFKSGIYLYSIESGNITRPLKKMILY
ncbi:MAG: T9SS type A sorting domain-containing protein [Bacteroidales bacterium]|nr:T9SS type A sorting domain-containing protein [Bacteroidales bacterium]